MFNFLPISKLINYKEFILYLILILLITGPALPDILATILSLFCLFFLFKYKNFNENFYILIVPYIFLILPNLFSSYFPVPFLEQLINLRYVFFSLFIVLYYKIEFDNLIKFLLFITIIISIDLIFQYTFKFNILGMDIYGGHNQSRASSFFRDELIAGSYILKLSLPILGYFFYKKKFLILIILLSIYQMAIISSGERMSFILYNFGIILLAVFHFERKYYKFFVLSFISILTIILSSYFTFDGVKHRVNTTLNMFNVDESNAGVTGKFNLHNSEHIAHYIIGYNLFKDNIVFGTGHKTFRVECKKKEYLIKTENSNKGCSTHPHNIYIELLSDSGFVGFLSFIVLVFLIIIKALKNKIYQSQVSGFFVSFIIIVWPISTAGNFFNNRNAIMNFIIIGILLYYCSKDLLNKKPKKNLVNNNKAKNIK